MLLNRGLDIDQLYRLYYRPMCLYAAHTLGDSGDVEDVVQDAFAALWDRMSNGDMPSKPEAYLATSVRNACIDRLRAGAAHPEAELTYLLEESIPDDDGVLEQSFSEARMWDAIDRLPEGRRRMLLMHVRDGLKCPEIAKRLGVSEGTVRNQIYRALKSLRRNY